MESLEILPIDGESNATEVQDVESEESLEFQVANDDESQSDIDASGDIVETIVAQALAETKPSRAPRLAFYAPIICASVAIAAGAMHFAYQWFGGGQENADLAVMSTKESESPGMPAQDSLLAPPTPFKLLVDEPAARADTLGDERLRADLSEHGNPRP